MADENKNWQTYEEVARDLLNQFVDKFGIVKVEGKQTIRGLKSGTDWEIDAKGVGSRDETFLLVECRRYTSSRQNQERIGALAYRIYDTGASGGIIVSPLGLQEGAEKIARTENIYSVILNPECTTENYILKFLNEVHVGLTDQIELKASVTITKMDQHGNIVETKTFGAA
jgi:hypothetical protein